MRRGVDTRYSDMHRDNYQVFTAIGNMSERTRLLLTTQYLLAYWTVIHPQHLKHGSCDAVLNIPTSIYTALYGMSLL